MQIFYFSKSGIIQLSKLRKHLIHCQLRTYFLHYINVREHRIGNQKMDNPEKLASLGIQDTGQRQGEMHHYTQTNMHNVNN